MVRTGQRFGAGHVIDVVVGNATERIAALGHDRIKTFGAGASQKPVHWRRVLADLLAARGSGDLPTGLRALRTAAGRDLGLDLNTLPALGLVPAGAASPDSGGDA